MRLQARLDMPVSSTNIKPLWSIQDTRTPLRLTKTQVSTSLPPYCDVTDHSLGTFLLNNYKQALEILDMRSAINTTLVKVGAQDMAMVKEWLKEEEL